MIRIDLLSAYRLDRRRAQGRERTARYAAAHRDEVAKRCARYDAEHREERRLAAAVRHAANRERDAADSRAYYATHKESCAARSNVYHAENREALAAKKRAYQAAHPELHSAGERNRKARKRAATGTHTAVDVAAQYLRQHGRCYWCAKKVGQDYHVDHVVPLARGGSNGPDNLVVACPTCNMSKGAKLPHEFSERMC